MNLFILPVVGGRESGRSSSLDLLELLIFYHKYGENFGFEENFRGAGVEGLKYGNKG